jgi:hypothetical protein
MNTGIILSIFGGILAILAYLFAPFITLVEDGVTVHAWQVATGQAALLLAVLSVALALWTLRSRRQVAGWGLAALALGQMALLVLTYAHVWALVPARALGLPADGQTGALVDGTLVMLDWGFALAAGQAAGALFAGLLVVAAHREFAKSQRFLKLAVQWGGQTVFERVLFDATPVTVGEADDALIQLAAGGLGSHLLLQPAGPERYQLNVPAFVKGQLHLHDQRVDAAGRSAEIGPGDAGVLWFDNDVSLVFGFTSAESTTLAAGLGREPGMVVSMAATVGVTLVLLLVMLAGQKARHRGEIEENAEAKQLAEIELRLHEVNVVVPDEPPEPRNIVETAPPAPIGPPIDHRAPKVGLPDRTGPTTVAKNDKPKGPIDVTKLGLAGELSKVPLNSAMGQILEGERGPLGSQSPLAVGGEDPSTEIGGGKNPIGFKTGDKGGGGEDPWSLVGMPNGTDPNGRDIRSSIAMGHKKPKKVEHIVIGQGTSMGGCDKGDIAKQVRARGSMVRACYETQLLSAPSLQGKLTAQWTIAGDGSVQGEKAVSDSLHNDAVGDCVLRAIRHIRFQAPEAGTCVIQWPFVFAPG